MNLRSAGAGGAWNGRLGLVGLCALLGLIAILPTRWTGWAADLGNLTNYLVAPVQGPAEWAFSWLRGPALSPRDRDAEIKRHRDEAEMYRQLYYRTLDDKQRLEQAIVAIQRGSYLAPEIPVRQVAAPVIGRYSDLSTEMLKVRVGAASGVTQGSVAVHDGVNLVGRVVGVFERVASVLPITDKQAGQMIVKVYPNESPGAGAPDPGQVWMECKLFPTGKGTLRGPVEQRPLKPGETEIRLAPGMIARLGNDGTWPRSAQSLIVGVIERVDTAANGRDVVTVKPVYDLRRLSELAIRISGEADEPSPAGAPGAGGRP